MTKSIEGPGEARPAGRRGRPRLSIVIPFLNEEAALPRLRERFESLGGMPETWEIIFVSDGSTDQSVEIVEDWASEDRRIKLLVLSRNFGHQPAISAGIGYARGEYVGVMDADLQDPPEVLLEMYGEACGGGWDVVYSTRARRRGRALKRIAYKVFYRLYSYLAQTPINTDSGDFSVLSRRAVSALLSLPEKVRFVRGLRSWIGLRQKPWPIVRPERVAGEPQYSWVKLAALAINGLTSFSVRPLQLATISGLLICLVAMLLAALYGFIVLFTDLHERVPGFATIAILLLFLNGFQFCLTGILGEYIGQIFQEVKRRPTYLVERVVDAGEAQGERAAEANSEARV